MDITRKSSGSYFIGTPNNKKQILVFTSNDPVELSLFCKDLYGRFIKAEYSKSTTYYHLEDLTRDFFEKKIRLEEKTMYDHKVQSVGRKVRWKARIVVSRLRSFCTTRAFTPEIAKKFKRKWAEISEHPNYISHKEANSFAWKKQRYLEIDFVDIVTLRNLIKKTINN